MGFPPVNLKPEQVDPEPRSGTAGVGTDGRRATWVSPSTRSFLNPSFNSLPSQIIAFILTLPRRGSYCRHSSPSLLTGQCGSPRPLSQQVSSGALKWQREAPDRAVGCLCCLQGPSCRSELFHCEKRAAGGWGRAVVCAHHLLSPVTRLTRKNQNQFGRGGREASENQEGLHGGEPGARAGLSYPHLEAKGKGQFPEAIGVSVKLGVPLCSPQLPLGARHSCPGGPARCPRVGRSHLPSGPTRIPRGPVSHP